jgi:hypothetical protein
MAGTSDKGACADCGSPYVRQVEKTRIARNELDPTDPRYRPSNYDGAYTDINGKGDAGYSQTTTLGWEKSCECATDKIVPQLILDPFSGSGTTGEVALMNGRNYIGTELNPEYAQLSEKRISTALGMLGEVTVEHR